MTEIARLRALPCVRLVSISGSLLCFSIDSFTNLESESPREPSISLHSERASELCNSRPGVTCKCFRGVQSLCSSARWFFLSN